MKSRILSMPDTLGALRLLREFSNFQFINALQVLSNWPSIFLNGQGVFFTEENAPDVARSDPPPPPKKKKKKPTTLTAFFSALSRGHVCFQFFCTLTFQDFTHGILRAKHGKKKKGGKRLKDMTYMKLKQLAEFIQ